MIWLDARRRVWTDDDHRPLIRCTLCATDAMDESGMSVRFDFAELAGDRNLRNKVFDAVDVHADWLALQASPHQVTERIDARLQPR